MNSLPQLRESLVSAAEQQAMARRPADRPAERPRGPLRRRGLRVLAGAVAIGVLAAAGTAIFGPTGNPRYITQFECGTAGHGDVHGLFTAEPVSACAALWPSIYHRPAPALTAWIYETGGAVLVRPAAAPAIGKGWRRLPKGWKADSAVIELNDQLEDITTGLPSRPCWSAPAAAAMVTGTLHADGLDHWHLRVSTQPSQGDASGACMSVIQAIGGPEIASDTILLVEHAVHAPAKRSSWYPNRFGEQRRLAENRVNHALRVGGHCASLAQAVSLWRSQAHTGGIPTNEYVMNAPAPETAAGAHCARVFISEPGGGGPANVFAADYP
ncbi:MAG TPA: hypothetical protein VID48_11055 [Solirubrobacteraceae bacterium]|jgi:hypothetical protein